MAGAVWVTENSFLEEIIFWKFFLYVFWIFRLKAFAEWSTMTSLSCSRNTTREWWQKTNYLQHKTTRRVGERIPLQPIHLQAEKIRNRAIARTYGKTSENLVPESAEKMEKRKQDSGGSLKEGRNSEANRTTKRAGPKCFWKFDNDKQHEQLSEFLQQGELDAASEKKLRVSFFNAKL